MSLKHILLGLLDEPAAGYDLKKAFDESLQHFWNAKLSQIYPSLQRMEKEGLLKSEMQPSAKGPQRRVYRRTSEGQEDLHDWLSGKPILADVRIHYLAQLFFLGELDDLDQTHAFFLDLRRSFKQHLEGYLTIERQLAVEYPGFPDVIDPEIFHPFLALQYGKHRIQANLEWCGEAIRQTESQIASNGPPSSDSLSQSS